MTVSYQYDVGSSASGGFTRLLFKWKGSLYKLVYRELAIFVFAYALMSIVYRYVFNEDQKRSFERVALYCDTFMNYIPLSFILGFYVSFVASRWWQQYMAIPWPDKILHSIALHVIGYDDKGRMLRRTMVRYLNLSLVLVLRSISSAVKKRFPTLEHLIDAGFITPNELEIYKMVPTTDFNTYWVPCTWFTGLMRDARQQKRIIDPHGTKLIMEELLVFRELCGMLWSYDWVCIPLVYTQMFLEFRSKCGLLWCYDWVSIPLVYTQVVTIATYAFFIACIIGRQYVEKSPIPFRVKPDLYIPYFTLLQFFFYMGLLKVAEQLINPFGDDDEDFELNWIIDRHIKVSYLVVDTLILRVPPLTKDIYFDEESPVLPYTEAAVPFKKRTYKGSVDKMMIPEHKQVLILPEIEEEFDHGGGKGSKKGKIAEGIMSSTAGVLDPQNGGASGSGALNIQEDGMGRGLGRASLMLGADGRKSTSGIIGSIGQAVASIGSSQMFLATSPEALSDVKEEEEDVDYVVLSMDNFNQDPTNKFTLSLPTEEYKSGHRSSSETKPSFRLPASLKARLAMRKKPVIKWKPYVRPAERLPEAEDLTDDLFSNGCFEDECAFMWRTIDEEIEPLKQSPPDAEVNRSGRSTLSEIDNKAFVYDLQEHQVFSKYEEIRPRSNKKTYSLFPENSSPFLDVPHSEYRAAGVERNRYKTRGRSRPSPCLSHGSLLMYQGSLPELPCPECGATDICTATARSLSENSVFLDAVADRLKGLSNIINPLFTSGSSPTTPRRGNRRRKSHFPIVPNGRNSLS